MILWDVDTQVGLVAAARESGIIHVASADDHELTDPEISSVAWREGGVELTTDDEAIAALA